MSAQMPMTSTTYTGLGASCTTVAAAIALPSARRFAFEVTARTRAGDEARRRSFAWTDGLTDADRIGYQVLPDRFRDRVVPKFRPGGILLAHAGGGAGLFSSIIAGWANGEMGSQPVTRTVGP